MPNAAAFQMTSVTPLFSLLKSIFQTVGTTLRSCSRTFLTRRSPPCHHEIPAPAPALMTQKHHWQQLWSFPESSVQFSPVQSLSHVQLLATPWTAARQASLSITISWSLLKLVHLVGDAIQPPHPLLSPSPPAFDLSQHQGLFQWVSSSHQVATVLEQQLQHQSFQWITYDKNSKTYAPLHADWQCSCKGQLVFSLLQFPRVVTDTLCD